MLSILRARLLEQLRWAREHVYTWLVLGPIVFGMTYATVDRIAGRVAEWVELSFGVSVLIGAVAGAALITMSLTRTAIEVYHIQQPESMLEASPLTDEAHLHLALASRFTRNVVLGVAVLAFRSLVNSEGAPVWGIVVPFSLLVTLITTAEVFAAINWIHFGHTRARRAGVAAAAYLAITTVPIGLCLVSLLSLATVSNAMGSWFWLASAGLVILTYIVTRECHDRWRGYDIEFARRLQTRSRRGLARLQLLRSRLGAQVHVQLARDLLLTLRGFSSTVYVVLIVVLLELAAMMALLRSDLLPNTASPVAFLDAAWLPSVIATKVGAVLATGTLCAIVPALVSYELPHLWLERSVGITGEEVLESKLWYARMASCPAPLLAFVAAIATGRVPTYYSLPLLAECLWNWWLVSTVMGSLAFEAPYRRAISNLIMLSAGLTIGAISLLAWPLGLLLYVHVGGSLAERGESRAHFCLLEGED